MEGGEELALNGDVYVTAGSRESRGAISRGGLRASVGHLFEELPERAQVRALREGDRVLAQGVVAYLPPAAEASGASAYRDGTPTLALVARPPEEEDGTAVLLAHTRAPRPLGLAPLRALFVTAGSALAVWTALAALGLICLETGTPRGRVLASATPTRAQALARLRGTIDLERDVTIGRVREAAALDQLRGACAEAAELLVHHHDSTRALAVAAECRLPRIEALARLAKGNVDLAADAMRAAREADPSGPPPGFLEASTLLAAGRWGEAGRVLRQLASAAPAPYLDGDRERSDELRCIAGAAERLAGGAASVEQRCTLEAADAAVGPLDPRDGPWRAELFGAADGPPRLMSAGALRYTLYLDRGDARVPYRSIFDTQGRALRVFRDPRGAVHAIPPALAASALARLEGREGRAAAAQRSALELHLAHVAAYFGDLAGARHHVTRAREQAGRACEGRRPPPVSPVARELGGGGPPPPPPSDPRAKDDETRAARDGLVLEREADAVALALDVRDGAPVPPERVYALGDRDATLLGEIAEWKRTGTSEAFLVVRRRLPEHEGEWKYVAENDPFGLVRRLEDHNDRGRGVVDLLGGERGAYDELARWVRVTFPPITRDILTVQDLAEHLAMRHVAARAAHAQDVVDETWSALAALRPVFARRDRALLLAHLDEVAHAAPRTR